MFFTVELLYFVIMIAVFAVMMFVAKQPASISLMVTAIAGMLTSTLVGLAFDQSTPFELRYLMEGAFGYYDTLVIIVTAMIFMAVMKANGGMDYISALLVKALRRWPTLLLIALMIIIMFPGMVTGTSLSCVVISGVLVAPILTKWGVPKAKTAAVIAVGALLGCIAPPISVPSLLMCDTVDIPYTEFTLPLLLATMPVAIISVLLLARKYVKPIAKEDVEKVVNTQILKELNWTVCIPFIVLILLVVSETLFPKVMGSLAMPAMFVICTIIACFVGRRLPLYKKGQNQLFSKGIVSSTEETDLLTVMYNGVCRALPVVGLLVGTGMFMEILSLSGVRGYLVINAITLPKTLQYIAVALLPPIMGGLTTFSSASMLGGPFVMALQVGFYPKAVVCGLSLLVAVGEFMPPTAVAATFSGEIVGEKKWKNLIKAAWPALLVVFAYSLLYIFGFSNIIFKATSVDDHNGLYLVMLAITMGVAIVFAVVWDILVNKIPALRKHAHGLEAVQQSEEPTQTQQATEE